MNSIYIGDFEGIKVYVEDRGIVFRYEGLIHYYIHAGYTSSAYRHLTSQINIIGESNCITSGPTKLTLYRSGYWGLTSFSSSNKNFNLLRFKNFIVSNKHVKDILLLEDILE